MKDPVVFRKIVSAHTSNDGDGPAYAIACLTKSDVKRIKRLAREVARLKVAYIMEWGCPSEIKNGDIDLNTKCPITDETPQEELALYVNDDDPITAITVKHRLAGHSATGPEVFQEIVDSLDEFDGSLECEMLRISADNFHYTGILRHTDCEWFADGILISELPEVD